jgi:hypothetical protein
VWVQPGALKPAALASTAHPHPYAGVCPCASCLLAGGWARRRRLVGGGVEEVDVEEVDVEEVDVEDEAALPPGRRRSTWDAHAGNRRWSACSKRRISMSAC